jgi:hypothetical protein
MGWTYSTGTSGVVYGFVTSFCGDGDEPAISCVSYVAILRYRTVVISVSLPQVHCPWVETKILNSLIIVIHSVAP